MLNKDTPEFILDLIKNDQVVQGAYRMAVDKTMSYQDFLEISLSMVVMARPVFETTIKEQSLQGISLLGKLFDRTLARGAVLGYEGVAVWKQDGKYLASVVNKSESNNLGPLPKISDRHVPTELARRKLQGFMIDLAKEFDLTLVETWMLIADWLHGDCWLYVKHERRKKEGREEPEEPEEGDEDESETR